MLLYSFVPQVIGIVLLIFICVGLVVYVIRESCQQEVEMQDADVAELTVLRMSSLRTRTSWEDLHRPPHLPCWHGRFVNTLNRLYYEFSELLSIGAVWKYFPSYILDIGFEWSVMLPYKVALIMDVIENSAFVFSLYYQWICNQCCACVNLILQRTDF